MFVLNLWISEWKNESNSTDLFICLFDFFSAATEAEFIM